MEEIRESLNVSLLGAASPEGKDWDVVILEAGLSKNGHLYRPDVLRKAAPLFEGVRAFAYGLGHDPSGKPLFDHLPPAAGTAVPGGFSRNLVGWFESVRYGEFVRPDGSKSEGVLGRFHVLEGADWLRKSLKDSWEHKRPDILGFSIDARGKAVDRIVDGKPVRDVEAIESVNSTDVVTHPAAGGQVLRLVASQEAPAVKQILDLVAKHRPSWIAGRALPGPAEDVSVHVLAFVESLQQKASDAVSAIPAVEVESIAEGGRGMATLAAILELLKAGNVEDAIKVLQAWVSAYPEPKNGNPYGYPYARAEEYPAAPSAATAAGEQTMNKPETPAPAAAPAPVAAAMTESVKPAETQKADKAAEVLQAAEQKLAEIATRERAVRIRERVGASGLPVKAQVRVIESLVASAQEVKDEEIDAAVAKEREYIAAFSESGKPSGLGGAGAPKVEVTKEQHEKLVDAFEGMLSMQSIGNVRPFRGLHESFARLAGGWRSNEEMADCIFESIRLAFPRKAGVDMENHLDRLRKGWAGIPKSDALRESVTTSDWSVTFGDALYRRLQKLYTADPLNDWRKIVSSIENLKDATSGYRFPRIGYTGVLPTVNQNAPYQEFATDPNEVSETMTPAKRGALLKLTWEDVLADSLGAIRRIPQILARSSVRTIHQLVWDQIEGNPTLADSVALVNATHANLVSGSPALSYADLVSAVLLLRDQTEPASGEKMGLAAKYLLVGPKKEGTAIELTDSLVKINAAEDATAASAIRRWGVQAFPSIGLGRSATTDDRWYVCADPANAETIAVGFLGGRDMPDIFVQSPDATPTEGAAFDADAMTFKVRLVVGARVLDHRWIAGSLA